MHWLTVSLVALGTLAAAAPASAEAAKADGRDLPRLVLPDVEPKPAVLTRVPVTIAVELDWAKSELAQRIPRKLHQESNREVAPGILVDAQVTRGVIDFRIRDDAATGLVPVELQLAVRSKLGNLVLPLGQCRTTVDVELQLLATLTSDGKLSRPLAKANLREPCRLSGFDITPILRGEIDQRLDAAQTQISDHVLQANAVLQQIHAELWRRLVEAAVGCHRFLPTKLLQAPLTLEQGVVLSRFVAEGTVVDSCNSDRAPGIVVEQLTGPAGFDLAWSTRLGFPDFGAAVAEHLKLNGVVGEVKSVRAVRRDDADQLAMYVQLPKSRGWVFARPVITANAMTLGSVTTQQPELLKAVKSALETLLLPIDTMGADTLGQRVVLVSNEATQAFGNAPELKARYQTREADLRTEPEVLVDRDALVVVVHRRSL
jgi:hypothetical protein